MRRLGAAGIAAVLLALAASLPATAAGPLPAVPMVARAVAASQGYGCAVLGDATLACFGTNESGQLGLPRATPWALVAKRVAGLGGVREVATGWDFACALTGAGTVRCFGDDRFGQAGAAATTPRQWTPVAVPGLHGVRQVTAGYDHACALTAAKVVECWGHNEFDQLGADSRRVAHSAVPLRVPHLSSVRQLSAGAGFTCAVRSDHTVWCWGANGSTQLGRSLRLAKDPTPQRIAGITTARAVAAGSGHACALLAGGRVACWGENLRGQLGVPASLPFSPTPVAVPLFGATAIAAGFDHTCALLSTHHVACWGSDNQGQLGIGRIEPIGAVAVVPGLADVTQVAAGVFSTCARQGTGRVRCFGEGALGQLGTGGRARLLRASHPALVRAPA